MDEVMVLPDIPPMRQVLWALVISRIYAITFLFRISKDGAGIKNQSEVNKVLRSIMAYRSDNLIRNQLPLWLYYEIEDEFDYIIENS